MSVFNSPFNQVFRNPFGSPFNGDALSGATWTPAQLFLASEQGAWYDPSDFSTLFQDYLGTTPVAAVEQSVGLILDKRLGLVPTVVQPPLDALNFAPFGSTPPTCANTTYLSEPCGSIVFPANAGGYAVSRGDSWVNHSIVIGRRYLSDYRVALSRPLAGGETLMFYTTGSSGGGFYTLTSATPSGVWIDYPGTTSLVSNQTGSNYCVGFAGTAISSPVTLYIRQYRVREWAGNHASQSTTAAKPKLSLDGANYYFYQDRVDDHVTVAAGGGGTTGICISAAIRAGGAGNARTIWSDRGTNTGYRLSINASNQLVLSAGNGSAHTEVVGPTVTAGTDYVVTGWHDGTNLNVQLNAGAATSAAFGTATAGTAGFTIGKDNGAATGYYGDRIYEIVYRKNDTSSAGDRTSLIAYMAKQAGITL